MKTLGWALVLLLSLPRFLQGAADPRLLLHFDFEADAADRISDQTGRYNGVPTNIVHVPGRVGKLGVALRPALDGYIRVAAAGTALELANSPLTVACWYLNDLTTAPGTVVNHGEPGEIHADGPFPWPQALVTMGNHIFGDGTGYALIVQGRAVSAREGLVLASPIDPATWQHLAMVYDGTSMKVYTNGVLAASADQGPMTASGKDDLYVGNGVPVDGHAGGFPMNGALDDLRIYNAALSSDEIAALANAPGPQASLVLDPTDAGLVLSWQVTNPASVLESTSSIDSPQWTPAVTFAFTPNVIYTMTVQATTGVQFYRIREP